MTLISIVVPVYNVRLYLRKCLDSILNQSFKNLELILVNDGSDDGSGHICEEYACLDARVRVLHKENGGLPSACLAGISVATGKYIGFVDSDDWVDNDMFEKLYEAAVEYNADMVCSELTLEYGDRSEESSISQLGGYFNRERIEHQIIPILVNDGRFFGKAIRNNRVTKLFRTELVLKNLKYYTPEIVYGEDYQLVFPCILDSDVIYILNDFYPYHYRLSNNSLTRMYIGDMWNKYLALSFHIESIALDKAIYDFKPQILRELVYFAIMSTDNEFVGNSHRNMYQQLEAIRDICNNERLCVSLKEGDFKRYNYKVKLMIWLMKHRFYSAIFVAKKFKSIIR